MKGLWLNTEPEKFQKMSKTFGEKGIELVKEASRSNFNLAPFNEDVVRQVPAYKNDNKKPFPQRRAFFITKLFV